MCAGHGTNSVGDKPTTGIYRKCNELQVVVSDGKDGGSGVVVAVLVCIALGRGGDYQTHNGTSRDAVGSHGGNYFSIPAQQKGHRIAHLEGAQIAEEIGGGGGLDFIGFSGDCHRCGRGGRPRLGWGR